ncbi:type I secretion protein [Aquamicrobium ahrensii]|uniref:Type I secretion protein n=1 Tax=Aquamicrobium ahrensii TaxID=469551 RepID=A0ABV2KGX4_9HYPH
MHMDSTTEIIAHFIGVFSQTVEDVRLRLDYAKFTAQREAPPETPDLLDIKLNMVSPYTLGQFVAKVTYAPPAFDMVSTAIVTPVSHQPIPLHIPPGNLTKVFGHTPRHDMPGMGDRVIPEYEPIGSLALYLRQEAQLVDNDVLTIGSHGLGVQIAGDPVAALAQLVEAASHFQPLAAMESLHTEADAGDFILHVTESADTLPDAAPAGGSLFVAHGEATAGIHVNGESVDEAPVLEDLLPAKFRPPPEETEDDTPTPTGVDHSHNSKIELEAGGNLLVNEAVLVNNWYGAPVVATAGNYVHVNAISQTNVWSDCDAVSDALGGWQTLTSTPTQGFNVATIETISNPAYGAEPAGGSGFPSYWQVARIDGDLLIANWIKQISFVQDNDVTVMSASGGGATITLGGNTVVNIASLAELGSYYDLIIVGGSIYHGNIISQTNILLDDDLIATVGDFQTSGDASLSTGGNLLWNQASITQYGTMNFEGLPPSFQEAADKLASGPADAPSGLLQHDAFGGLTGLKVLYISGDVIDLQYISQTNILGDADQVALAMDQAGAYADADWNISTGANALVNHAHIVDGGVDSTVYAGGHVYSDELLIQAELISNDSSSLYMQDANALVSEAVVFLSDDMLTPDADDGGPVHDGIAPGAGSADVMQTMLS